MNKYHSMRLILGDQLNASHSWYKEQDDGVLYVIAELHQEASYVRHHIQKVCAFFAAMESFASALKAAGHQVRHLILDDTAAFATLSDLIAALCTEHGIVHFAYQQPDEYRLAEQLRQLVPLCLETLRGNPFAQSDEELLIAREHAAFALGELCSSAVASDTLRPLLLSSPAALELVLDSLAALCEGIEAPHMEPQYFPVPQYAPLVEASG